jgi:hypothetical protein
MFLPLLTDKYLGAGLSFIVNMYHIVLTLVNGFLLFLRCPLLI